MADFPAQPNQTNPSQSSKLSSKEYLEQMRARRAARVAPVASQPAAAPQVQNQPAYEAPAQPTQPVEAVQPEQPEPTTQQAPVPPITESEVFPGQYKPLPEETVFEWKAASRPFKKRNRQFYTTVGLISVLISMILFFAGQFLPIAVVIAVAFLGYVLSSVPPDMIVNKITTYGIRTDTTLIYWDELGRFWFDSRYDQPLVEIETARFPGRITLLLGNVSQNEIEKLLSEVLLKQKPTDTFIDKSAKWIQEKIPLDIN